MIPASLCLSFHDAKLNAAAAYVLARLNSDGPLHPGDLVGEGKLNRNEAARRLRELRVKGLICRLPNTGESDGRSLPYDLTDAGRALINPKAAKPAAR